MIEHSDETDIIVALTGLLTPQKPSLALRERLMHSVQRTSRFSRFKERVAALIDKSVTEAEKLLAEIDTLNVWQNSPWPSVFLYHLEGGPKVMQAIVGFIKIKASAVFPEHTHLGTEHVLILQGGLTTQDGKTYLVGEEIILTKDSTHEVTALPEVDLIYLVIVDKGICINGVEIKSDTII